jgi:hypothetical protein
VIKRFNVQDDDTAYQMGSMPAASTMGLKMLMVMHSMEMLSRKHPGQINKAKNHDTETMASPGR